MLQSPKNREEFIEQNKQRIYEVCAGKVLQDENAAEIASYVYSKGIKHSDQAKKFDCLYDKALLKPFV